MAIGVTCWRCEEPGHVADDCHRPPPKSRKERDARNARHLERWYDGAITTTQKRNYIAMENRAFEKEMASK